MLISSAAATHEKGIRILREPDFPHWTCAYLNIGSIRMKTERQTFDVVAGSYLIIPPHCPYEFDVTVPDEHIWAIFDAPVRFPPSLQAAGNRMVVFKLNNEEVVDAEIIAAMREMLKWWQMDPMRPMLAENALERALLLSGELEQGKEKGLDARIAKALSYIARDSYAAVSVTEVAGYAGLSPSRFAALFKHETGQTPARYMEIRRLEVACERLLHTTLTIAEVAESVGYKNAFHFSTRFRAVYDQAPREFRRHPQRVRHIITPEDRS